MEEIKKKKSHLLFNGFKMSAQLSNPKLVNAAVPERMKGRVLNL